MSIFKQNNLTLDEKTKNLKFLITFQLQMKALAEISILDLAIRERSSVAHSSSDNTISMPHVQLQVDKMMILNLLSGNM